MVKLAITERVQKIRAERREKDLSFRRLAELAGVPASTIQDMDRPDWNPTLNTLVAVEAALFSAAERGAA